MERQECVEIYLSHHTNLMPLSIKRKPIKKGWVTNPKQFKTEQIKEATTLGWILSLTDLVIDVDPRNGGTESFERLCKDLNLSLTYNVKTPRGGFHIYCKLPQKFVEKISDNSTKLKAHLDQYKGIDFKSHGGFVVIGGSEAQCGDTYGCYEFNPNQPFQIDCPEALIALLTEDRLVGIPTTVDTDFSNLDEKKIKDLLSKISPDCDYERWIHVGMGLHLWDNSKKGFELWDNWSKLCEEKYDVTVTSKQWTKFADNRNPEDTISPASLYYFAEEAELKEHNELIYKILNSIREADENKLNLDIIRTIKKGKFSELDNERFAVALKERFQTLHGVKYPIASMRKKIKSDLKENKQIPEWCKEWVCIATHNCYYNMRTNAMYKSEMFNQKNTQYVTEELGSDGDSNLTAHKYVMKYGFIEVCDGFVYLPEHKEKIVHIDGKAMYNKFNSTTLPMPSHNITDDGYMAIELIKRHLELLVGKDNAETLLCWIAHNVQYPSRKIMWAPVLQSGYGFGKQFVGELLQRCMGYDNVKIVGPQTIVDKYTGWATNSAVNVLNEVRIAGQNRFEVMNKLKPFITDDIIDVRDMYANSYSTKNTCNYICFTNYKDAIPIEESDRRWWILFCDYVTIEEWQEAAGVEGTEYFNKLYDSLRTHAAEIHKWLKDYHIPQWFLDIKRAPLTDYKKLMVSTENSSHEEREELKELIKTGGKGVNIECFTTSGVNDLIRDKLDDFEEFNISHKSKAKLFKELGYLKYSTPIRWGEKGKLHNVWVRRNMSLESIKSILDKTLKENKNAQT